MSYVYNTLGTSTSVAGQESSFTNIISVAYWDGPTDFDAWFERYSAGWTDSSVAESDVGTFTEILKPTVERFETLFSSNVPEGVACVADSIRRAVDRQ
jgi:aldoxime dehydratase